LKELVMFLLDLEDPPRPFSPPVLKGSRLIQDRWVKSPRDGKLFSLPMEGLVIPRRYGKDRARRLVTGFIAGRSMAYWNEVQDRLEALVDNSVDGYQKIKKLGLLDEAVGPHAARLVRTVQDPTLQLSKSETIRTTTLTPRDKQRAGRLYRGWYPLVKRYVKSRGAGARPKNIPDDLREKIRLACEREQQPQRITLLMIAEELNLAVGLETLRRKLGPNLK
jgi:hypothetical protein